MVNGRTSDLIYELEDELITLNQKLITLHRLESDVKETIEIQVELDYRQAKTLGDTALVEKLSNEKLRKHEAKERLNVIEVQINAGEDDQEVEPEFVRYADLVELMDAAELDKLNLLREIGFQKREFVREFGRAGMQALSDLV